VVAPDVLPTRTARVTDTLAAVALKRDRADASVRLAERLISWARRDAVSSIAPDLSGADLASIVGRRSVDATRGVIRGIGLARVAHPFFVGRGVGIIGQRHLRVGRGCVLQDFVTIDAVSRRGVTIGDNVTLERFVIIRCTGALRELGEGVSIGDNSSIGAFSFVGGSGGVTIGSGVLGGQRLGFHPENHVFERSDVPIREQGTERAAIVVEDDCWLGAGATFLAGVTVGRGSIVGAGSVVTTDVAPFSRVAGVPARVIGSRLPGTTAT